MIFASDLDQTLIYSRKSFRAPIEDESIQLIETIDGKEISFISHKTILLLKNYNCTHISSQLQQELLSSFSVLLLFQNEIIPEYAITSNGGNILHNGKQDGTWNRKVKERLSVECIERNDILKEFGQIAHKDWVISQKQLMIYSIIALLNGRTFLMMNYHPSLPG